MLIEYEGTSYQGSQYQSTGTTIQYELERAISNLTSESNRVALAGRTDARVHASGQVASFLTKSPHSDSAFLTGLNHYLPEDIAVKKVVTLPENFDVRRNARSRLYCYTIHNGYTPSPLRRNMSWHIRDPLNFMKMNTAALELMGEHDFSAFTNPSVAQNQPTTRNVLGINLSSKQQLIRIEIEANSFLTHQVRRTVGCLVAIGNNKMSVEDFRSMILLPVPGSAYITAPPQGLCLIRVRYDKDIFENGDKNENI